MRLLLGDCLERLKELPDNSVDSIVTDPPYGLGKEPDALKMITDWIETGHHEVKGRGFMGKEWDAFVPQPQVWHECLRVLKPGGHLLAFAGTRTQDLMALGLRLAGFEIRDMIGWCYGSGFPKSANVSKMIDKAAGAEREVVGKLANARPNSHGKNDIPVGSAGLANGSGMLTAPATDAAKQWDGFGTALKPALEPLTLARKPLEGTVAGNVLKWHTGALNIDGCRVSGEGYSSGGKNKSIAFGSSLDKQTRCDGSKGRWPANLIHDGSDEVLAGFPDTKSGTISPHHHRTTDGGNGNTHGKMAGVLGASFGDSGSAARFFYCAKTSKKDRDEGCEHLPEHQEGLQLPRGKCPECSTWKNAGEERCACGGEWEMTSNPPPKARNNHPTVKPTDLMRYLCRLVTPPGGTIVDPYMGSGSTGKAAKAEGFDFIGIERDPDYFAIAQARILGDDAFTFE